MHSAPLQYTRYNPYSYNTKAMNHTSKWIIWISNIVIYFIQPHHSHCEYYKCTKLFINFVMCRTLSTSTKSVGSRSRLLGKLRCQQCSTTMKHRPMLKPFISWYLNAISAKSAFIAQLHSHRWPYKTSLAAVSRPTYGHHYNSRQRSLANGQNTASELRITRN